MDIKCKILVLLLWCILFANCTTKHFNISTLFESNTNNNITSQDSTEYTQDHPEAMAYCNQFNINGFSGLLVASYNQVTQKFNSNKAELTLWTVPDEFLYPKTHYIQFHSFNISSNKTRYNQNPQYIKVINHDGYTPPYILTSIEHTFLEDRNNISINTLLENNIFILEGLDGWQGLSMSVFNTRNEPIKTAQILTPPFIANPHTFLNTHHKQKVLSKLHPMWNIVHLYSEDKIFYDKAKEFCKQTQIQFVFPPLPNKKLPHPTEQFIDDAFSPIKKTVN